MFVFSFKLSNIFSLHKSKKTKNKKEINFSKRKIFLLSWTCILSLALYLIISISISSNSIIASSPQSKQQLSKSSDNSIRINFLTDLGWKVDENPTEVCEIKIPEKFNNVYEKYNNIQKSQNFSLENYKGKTCKRYTYKILNYKNNQNNVNAHIIMFDDKIIGGDISSNELNGFMHGLSNPEKESEKSSTTWSPKKVSKSQKTQNVTKSTYKENPDLNSKVPTD